MSRYENFVAPEEINVNGRVYVDKEQLMQLIKDEKKYTLAGTEPGYICDDEGQRTAAFLALNHLGALLRKKELDAKYNRPAGQWVICSPYGSEDGVFVYLSGYCKHVPGRGGKETPVFKEDVTQAILFEGREDARETIREIEKEHKGLELHAVPAYWPKCRTGLIIMHAQWGWPAGRGREDVLSDELIWTDFD
jgi:hypothetical protein